MIYRFKYTHDFLTNFYAKSTFTYKGIEWTTSEAAFQAMKSFNKAEWERFSKMKPGTSKKEGRKLDLTKSWGSPAEWNKVAPDFMYEIVKAKFEVPENKELLLSTKGEYLIEGTGGPGFYGAWHDRLWGVCRCDKCKKLVNKNLLGNILMRVRDELSGNNSNIQYGNIAPFTYTTLSEEHLDGMVVGSILEIPEDTWNTDKDSINLKEPIYVCTGYMPYEDLGNGKMKSLRNSYKILEIKNTEIDGVPKKIINVSWPCYG